MAFSQSDPKLESLGSLRASRGNWDGTAVTTGELNTGLNRTFAVFLTVNDATAANGAVTVVETFPIQTAVTINFASGVNGEYLAIGEA